MKKLLFIAIILLSSQYCLHAQDTTRVLFIGNSLTYVNDLPTVFKSLSLAGGHYAETGQSVFGGYTLAMHYGNPQTLQLIQQGNWDYVVLQEQSQIPSMAAYLIPAFYPYGIKLDSLIHHYNPAAKTVMFLTFAHRNGDEAILGSGGFDTYWLMQGRLRESYLHLADSINAIVAPVGCAWREVRMADPALELYGDPVHPSVAGTYLAANVFYVTLFQQSSAGNTYMAGLDAVTAQFIQQKASSVVLDSLAVWNIGPFSGVTFPAEHGKAAFKASFNENSSHLQLSWDAIETGSYYLNIYNLSGQRVLDTPVQIGSRSGSIDMELPKLKHGIYLIKLSGMNYSAAIRAIYP